MKRLVNDENWEKYYMGEYGFSKDVEACMERTGRQFTDFERAALIYNSHLPYMDIRRELESIQDTTRDEALKKQIWERLSYERKGMEQFLENTAGYVYAVRIYEAATHDFSEYNDICGYFADPEDAFGHGRDQKVRFDIEKYQIVGWNQTEAKKSKCYINPYLYNEAKTEELIMEVAYTGMPEAVMRYDEKGMLCSFEVDELPCSMEKNLEFMFDPNRFENAYIDIPNPFEAGDIVRLITGEGYGVVVDTQETWKKRNEKMKSSKTADRFDMGITVKMFFADGQIWEGHICPIWLEYYEPTLAERGKMGHSSYVPVSQENY